MKVLLKRIGSSAKFVNWLKGFKDINSSILIEVDLNEQSFISKCFPTSKAVLKYSCISFEDAGYELRSIYDDNDKQIKWPSDVETASGRIMIGIFEKLSKVIDVFNMFSETEHDLTITFEKKNDIQYIRSASPVSEYQVNALILKSLTLTMVIHTSKISEYFEKCDDNTFNNVVCKIISPVIFAISGDTISNLTKISSVFAVDKMTDLLKLVSKKLPDGQKALYAYDESGGSFEYLLGYYESGADKDVSITMFKENFLNATKSIANEDINIVLDAESDYKVLLENATTKIIIAKAVLPSN